MFPIGLVVRHHILEVQHHIFVVQHNQSGGVVPPKWRCCTSKQEGVPHKTCMVATHICVAATHTCMSDTHVCVFVIHVQWGTPTSLVGDIHEFGGRNPSICGYPYAVQHVCVARSHGCLSGTHVCVVAIHAWMVVTHVWCDYPNSRVG